MNYDVLDLSRFIDRFISIIYNSSNKEKEQGVLERISSPCPLFCMDTKISNPAANHGASIYTKKEERNVWSLKENILGIQSSAFFSNIMITILPEEMGNNITCLAIFEHLVYYSHHIFIILDWRFSFFSTLLHVQTYETYLTPQFYGSGFATPGGGNRFSDR